MVKKLFDKDLQLYLDIEKELRLNLTLSKKVYLRDLNSKTKNSHTYYIYISMKNKEVNNLLERLSKRLNIITITKFT